MVSNSTDRHVERHVTLEGERTQTSLIHLCEYACSTSSLEFMSTRSKHRIRSIAVKRHSVRDARAINMCTLITRVQAEHVNVNASRSRETLF